MSILKEPRQWSRPRRETGRTNDLTPEEQANVRAALKTLKVRAGGWPALAAALKMSRFTLKDVSNRGGAPSAGVAVRAARLAGVKVDDILSGTWPPIGTCPLCGRAG